MKIGVIGAGYVGLTVSLGLADAGHEVMTLDSDLQKLHFLKMGQVPFYEPGLEDLLHRHQSRLRWTSSMKELVHHSQVVFLTVNTPEAAEGRVNLDSFFACASEVLSLSPSSMTTLVIKSTVPVGTAATLQEMVTKNSRHPALSIVSNPEFLRQGHAVEDFLRPDRVILGVREKQSEEIMRRVYEPITKSGQIPLYFMDHASAELTKYAANSFLALKVSFINELAEFSQRLGADIDHVKRGFTSDHRINPSFFNPGIGFGGSCFPKDLKALIYEGQQLDLETPLLEATLKVNGMQIERFLNRIEKEVGTFQNCRIGVLGLAFKPHTDDVRQAPSVRIIEHLVQQGALVQAFDPVALDNATKACRVSFNKCHSSLEAAKDAQALLILTEWPEFHTLDLNELKSQMAQPLVVDGRNLFDPDEMKRQGFRYVSVGRLG